MKKKSSHSAVIYTHGRWTGNNIFLRVALHRPGCVYELGFVVDGPLDHH